MHGLQDAGGGRARRSKEELLAREIAELHAELAVRMLRAGANQI